MSLCLPENTKQSLSASQNERLLPLHTQSFPLSWSPLPRAGISRATAHYMQVDGHRRGSACLWLETYYLHPWKRKRKKHKKKQAAQNPSACFADVKCPGCYKVITTSRHAQTAIPSGGCSAGPCQPTEEKPGSEKDARLQGSSSSHPRSFPALCFVAERVQVS